MGSDWDVITVFEVTLEFISSYLGLLTKSSDFEEF